MSSQRASRWQPIRPPLLSVHRRTAGNHRMPLGASGEHRVCELALGCEWRRQRAPATQPPRRCPGALVVQSCRPRFRGTAGRTASLHPRFNFEARPANQRAKMSRSWHRSRIGQSIDVARRAIQDRRDLLDIEQRRGRVRGGTQKRDSHGTYSSGTVDVRRRLLASLALRWIWRNFPRYFVTFRATTW